MSLSRTSFGVAIGVCIILIVIAFTLISPSKFSRAKWRHARVLRPYMVEDLLRTHDLKGMSRQQVNELLGQSNSIDTYKTDRYIYWIGSNGIDDNWMELLFENELVVEIRRWPD